MDRRVSSSSDVSMGFPEQVSDSSVQQGQAPSWPWYTPIYVPAPEQTAIGASNSAQEEASAQHFAREEGGRSQGNPGLRHGVNTLWQSSLVPVAAHVGGGNPFVRDEDHHHLQMSRPCTGGHLFVPSKVAHPLAQEQYNPTPSPATTEYSQPQSVQSSTYSAVEEEEDTYSTIAPVVALPNSKDSELAVKVYDGICKSSNRRELCVGHELPVYGKQAAKHRAKFVEVETNGLKVERRQLCVPFCVPFPYKSLRMFVDDSQFLMAEDGGLWLMKAVFQFIRTLAQCHCNPDCTGALYGAVSNLSNILTSRMTKKGGEPLVGLLPCLENFVEVARKLRSYCPEGEVVREGRLRDIKALGDVLLEVLPLIREREKLHVSLAVQKSLEQAVLICEQATTGDQMANIARTLRCHDPLSMLYLKGLPNTVVDIVCFEKEKISQVLDNWLVSSGAPPLSQQPQFQLHYTSPPHSRVLPDNEVCYPKTTITLTTSAGF